MIAYWKPFFSRIWRVFFFLSDTQKRSAHWDKYLLFVHKFNLHHSGPKFKGRKKIFLWYKIQIKSFFQNWIFGPKLDFCPSVFGVLDCVFNVIGDYEGRQMWILRGKVAVVLWVLALDCDTRCHRRA